MLTGAFLCGLSRAPAAHNDRTLEGQAKCIVLMIMIALKVSTDTNFTPLPHFGLDVVYKMGGGGRINRRLRYTVIVQPTVDISVYLLLVLQ